ncbi:MAG: hypothetical protein N2114_02155, partial [Candidatus Goldbacteria bacterium]|nr:hypothetical protein [Candidatus Goldiibacteriota bacterium]
AGVKYAAEYNAKSFYENQINLRKQFRYPPFTRILQIITQHEKQENSLKKMNEIKKIIDTIINKNKFNDINILGPAPAPLFKLRNKYRYSIILKCGNINEIKIIGAAVKKERRGNDVLVIVDPVNTL